MIAFCSWLDRCSYCLCPEDASDSPKNAVSKKAATPTSVATVVSQLYNNTPTPKSSVTTPNNNSAIAANPLTGRVEKPQTSSQPAMSTTPPPCSPPVTYPTITVNHSRHGSLASTSTTGMPRVSHLSAFDDPTLTPLPGSILPSPTAIVANKTDMISSAEPRSSLKYSVSNVTG